MGVAGVAAGWGVLHIKFLSLCHVYRRRASLPPPCWQSAPNWLLFNRDATSVSCGLLHILCISCPQIAVHPAPHPLPPLLPRSAPLLLAAKAPKSYSLCHRIASNNFASVSTSVSSACHTPPLACLVVCFCRASERFAHLPVYMCCAAVYCSQWAWQGAGRRPSLNEPQPLPAATSNYQFIFLACNSNVATWQRFAQLINFCAFLMAVSPTPHFPFSPPCRTKRCKIALRILMIKLISSSSNCHVNACPCNCMCEL